MPTLLSLCRSQHRSYLFFFFFCQFARGVFSNCVSKSGYVHSEIEKELACRHRFNTSPARTSENTQANFCMRITIHVARAHFCFFNLKSG